MLFFLYKQFQFAEIFWYQIYGPRKEKKNSTPVCGFSYNIDLGLHKEYNLQTWINSRRGKEE